MFIIFFLKALLLVLGASENTYFVKPDNFSLICPTQKHPCLTLDEYASNLSEFFTSDMTFLFLGGTHTTRTVVLLANVSNILLKGLNKNPESCKTDLSIKCKYVLIIMLQGLTMGYTGGTFNSILTLLASSTLTLHTIFEDSKTRAIYVNNSVASIEECTFRRNSPTEGYSLAIGGALFIRASSTVTISNSNFIENSAQSGGAVLVDRSEVSISK